VKWNPAAIRDRIIGSVQVNELENITPEVATKLDLALRFDAASAAPREAAAGEGGIWPKER
jgi:hypothetical protein